MSGHLDRIRSVSALRSYYGNEAPEASPALGSAAAALKPRAGEIVLTPGQKVALLRMRRSDWSKAVLAKLQACGVADCSLSDYQACARLGLAIHKGSFHVLTGQGRFRADRIAMDFAREIGMHWLRFDLGGNGVAAKVQCTCGWSRHRTRVFDSYITLVHSDGVAHLQKVGAPTDGIEAQYQRALAAIDKIMAEG